MTDDDADLLDEVALAIALHADETPIPPGTTCVELLTEPRFWRGEARAAIAAVRAHDRARAHRDHVFPVDGCCGKPLAS